MHQYQLSYTSSTNKKKGVHDLHGRPSRNSLASKISLGYILLLGIFPPMNIPQPGSSFHRMIAEIFQDIIIRWSAKALPRRSSPTRDWKRSLTYLLTHLLTHSLFTHSLTHSLTHPLTHSLTHSLIHSGPRWNGGGV